MVTMIFFPFWIESSPEQTVSVDIYMIKVMGSNEQLTSSTLSYVFIPAALIFVLSIFSITRFKNRLTQIKLGAINSLLLVIAVGLTIYLVNQSEAIITETNGQYSIGFYCFIAAMFFNLLANRFIRKDEKLVKSIDRIR